MKDSESVEVERMKWFNLLLLYGTGDTPDDDPRLLREDPDRKLMSHLVEKIVLVKLKGNTNIIFTDEVNTSNQVNISK